MSNDSMAVAAFSITNLPPGSQGGTIVRLNIALIVMSTIIVALRIFARGRMVRALGLDDLLAVIACVLLVTVSALGIVAVGVGSGTDIELVPPDKVPVFFAHLVTLQLLYFWATAMVRLSIAAFCLRLSTETNFRRAVWAVACVTLAVTMAVFLFEIFECKHVPDLWDINAPNRQCLDKSKEAPAVWTHGAVCVAIDIGLVALPILVIYTNMKFSSKTIQVILVLCVGIFAVITGIIRLTYLVSIDFNVNTTLKMGRVAPWTDLEGHVGLWTGCFPALQPMIRYIRQKAGTYASSNLDGVRNLTRGSAIRSNGLASCPQKIVVHETTDTVAIIRHSGSSRDASSSTDVELDDLESSC